jgi:hypothetical protein
VASDAAAAAAVAVESGGADGTQPDADVQLFPWLPPHPPQDTAGAAAAATVITLAELVTVLGRFAIKRQQWRERNESHKPWQREAPAPAAAAKTQNAGGVNRKTAKATADDDSDDDDDIFSGAGRFDAATAADSAPAAASSTPSASLPNIALTDAVRAFQEDPAFGRLAAGGFYPDIPEAAEEEEPAEEPRAAVRRPRTGSGSEDDDIFDEALLARARAGDSDADEKDAADRDPAEGRWQGGRGGGDPDAAFAGIRSRGPRGDRGERVDRGDRGDRGERGDRESREVGQKRPRPEDAMDAFDELGGAGENRRRFQPNRGDRSEKEPRQSQSGEGRDRQGGARGVDREKARQKAMKFGNDLKKIEELIAERRAGTASKE